MELSLLSLDSPPSEHGAKRRRILSPPLDGPSRGHGLPPALSVDEVDEDDMMNDGTPKPWDSEGQRNLEDANEYKSVNSLLHDLHAEQQHRRLMSLSSHSNASSPGPSNHGWSPSIPRQPPTMKPDFAPHTSQNIIQDVPLYEKYRQDAYASEAMNGLCCANDVSVYDRYEETNRLLGSVFLERRRDLSASVDS